MATNPYQPQSDDITKNSQFTPTTANFDESKGVAGRVDAITSKGSPLMERAATRAKQGMNQRGLLNSSMAIGAGEAAKANATIRGNIGMKGLDLTESGRQFDTAQATRSSGMPPRASNKSLWPGWTRTPDWR
jgi:hypothetical protein